MSFWDNLNKRVKKLSLIDMKLMAGFGIAIGLLVAQLFPQISNVNVWWFVFLSVLFITKPLYVFFGKG